jgi:CDP-4-dehydro-6-deoxyglucose reductase
MPQPLSLSRAARLAGVSRGELQHQIRRQGVETFEGKIPVQSLLQLYPDVDLDRDPVLERLERIKTTAQPKSSYTDGWLPEPGVLVSRLHELNRVLVRTKSALNRAEKLLQDIRERLRERDDGKQAAEILSWIEQGLSREDTAQDRSAQLFAQDMFLRVMTATVTIKPSGHEFFVEGNESILEGALKAGLHMDYGCSSGNCGACKARVLSGEVQQIKGHDFVLSERERAQGHILACSWTAVTDAELEAGEATSARDLSRQQIRSRVTKVEPISEDSSVLHLRTPRSRTLRFMAGQRARLTDEDGNSSEYPIASCPCDGRNLEFLVRHRPDDAFADGVMARKIKNQVVLVDGPMGDFVLREETTEPAVFVAFGAGFAPIKSLVEQSISIDRAEHLHLYRVDRPLSGSRLDNLCRAWRDSLDNLSFTLIEQDQPANIVFGRISKDVADMKICAIYVAGTEDQVAAFRQAAQADGLDPESIRSTLVD